MTYTKLGFSQGQVLTAEAMNHIETGIDEAHKAVETANSSIETKQDKLVSGTNLKTINGESLLGGGDISTKVTIDSAISSSSMNPVQNKVIHAKFAEFDGAKVSKSGSRGTLGGYSVPSVTSNAVTIAGESADDIQVTGAVEVNVADGGANESWSKVVSITDASATITLGSNWTWAGGEVPTVEANCILVLYWNNTFGKANLIVGGE